jgi:hypothetical protein
MGRQYILRIEGQGRVNYQIVRGHRAALDRAHAYVSQDRNQVVAVLDATGRVVWRTDFTTTA